MNYEHIKTEFWELDEHDGSSAIDCPQLYGVKTLEKHGWELCAVDRLGYELTYYMRREAVEPTP